MTRPSYTSVHFSVFSILNISLRLLGSVHIMSKPLVGGTCWDDILTYLRLVFFFLRDEKKKVYQCILA